MDKNVSLKLRRELGMRLLEDHLVWPKCPQQVWPGFHLYSSMYVNSLNCVVMVINEFC